MSGSNLFKLKLTIILVNDVGLSYNPPTESHFNDLQKVCDNLMQAYRDLKCYYPIKRAG